MSNNGLIARMETAEIGAYSAFDVMEEKRYSEEEAKVYNAGRADGIREMKREAIRIIKYH